MPILTGHNETAARLFKHLKDFLRKYLYVIKDKLDCLEKISKKYTNVLVKNVISGSGPDLAKKFLIRRDLDPQHWFVELECLQN